MARVDKPHKSERTGERTERHDTVTAIAIDQAADGGRDEARGEQPGGKAAHRKGKREAPFRHDQRHHHDRRIEDGAPRQDLRDPEHADGAPGTEKEIAGCWHKAWTTLATR